MKNNNGNVGLDTSKNSKGGDFIAASSRAYPNNSVPRGYPAQTGYPSDAIQAVPLEVNCLNNFDRASRAFRALVQKERTISLYKEKQSFEKPSDKKRRKRNEMRRKAFELEMKQARIASGDDKPKREKREPIEPMCEQD